MTDYSPDDMIDAIICTGLPYMNFDWVAYEHDQKHMLDAFRATKGYQEAKTALQSIIAKAELAARLQENEQALYLFNNQVSKHYALMGAIAGADKDLSKGIFVDNGDRKSVVVSEAVDFSLPKFFEDRITSLKAQGDDRG